MGQRTMNATASAATGYCHACNKKLDGLALLCAKCYLKALNRLHMVRAYREYMKSYFVRERQAARISRGYFGEG